MLQTAFSSYWVILCLFFGAGYAYTLYSKKNYPWPKEWNWTLAALRFVVVSLLAFLFLEPFLQKNENELTPAKVVFLWDDTQSISMALDSLEIRQAWEQLQAVGSKLAAAQEVDIKWETVSSAAVDATNLPIEIANSSPLHKAIERIKAENIDNTLQELVLITDGIYNLGPSPDYFNYPFRISTVGLGDSSVKKDLAIKKLSYNKVAYQGNKFPITVLLTKSGFGAVNTVLSLRNNGTTTNKEVAFSEEERVKEVTFLLKADKKGYQSYAFSLQPQQQERNTQNNMQAAYLQIIEGRKKIVLLADAPHPDINAIKLALDGNDNYELTLAIAGITPYKKDKYDLAILFHLPNNAGVYEQEIQALKNKKTPTWFIAGAAPQAPAAFNQLNAAVQIGSSKEADNATVVVNPDFTPFELQGQEETSFSNFPPIATPFNKVSISPLAEVLFYKQIGQIKTDQPLVVFSEQQDSKQATTLLDGFWRWRLHAYRTTEKFEVFDDWISKTVRWLTTISTKEQFNIYPVADRFSAYEEVVFNVEAYDEVFEPVFGNTVKLQLANADTLFNFNFKTVNLAADFNVASLPAGAFTYSAQTTIGGKAFNAKGQFLVEENTIEALNIQADFELLKRLSVNNEGQFFHYSETDSLQDHLLSKQFTKTITGITDASPLVDSYWLYVFVLLLLLSEWFIRRYYGSY
jgi:hypothetical protein